MKKAFQKTFKDLRSKVISKNKSSDSDREAFFDELEDDIQLAEENDELLISPVWMVVTGLMIGMMIIIVFVWIGWLAKK